MAARRTDKNSKVPRKYRSIFVYLGTSLAVAIVTIAVVSGFAASHENSQSLVTQQVIVQHETDGAYRQIEGQLTQMIFWQDAYENIVRQWNQKWVAYQFGPYQDSMGNHLVAIYGPSGQLLFHHAGGRYSHVSRTDLANATGLAVLLRSVAVERMHQPPALHKGMTLIGGVPYFAVAGTVTPEQASDLALAQQRAFHVVFFAPVTTANYDTLTKGFAAYDTRVIVGDKQPAGFTAAALTDAAGHPLAWLTWKVQLPGTILLKTILPAMIGVFLLLALLQGLLMRRWQKMQRELFMIEAKARSAREESHAKSVFLGTISHELRTPLNAIIGFSDALLNRLFGPLGSPHYDEYAAHIRSSGYSLLKTVNDLIEIARIEARDTAVEQQRVDAALAAQLAIEGAVQSALRKNVELFFICRTGRCMVPRFRAELAPGDRAHSGQRHSPLAGRRNRDGGRSAGWKRHHGGSARRRRRHRAGAPCGIGTAVRQPGKPFGTRQWWARAWAFHCKRADPADGRQHFHRQRDRRRHHRHIARATRRNAGKLSIQSSLGRIGLFCYCPPG